MVEPRTAAILLWAATLILSPLELGAQQDRRLSLEAIFSADPDMRVEFSGKPLTGLRWLPDGSRYLQPSGLTDGDVPFLEVITESGSSKAFFDLDRLAKTITTLPEIDHPAALDLARKGMQFGPSYEDALALYEGNLLYVSLAADRAMWLSRGDEAVSEPDFSPDGQLVSFVRANNLYTIDVDSGQTRALTSEGSSTLFFGRLDWVYQEELYGRGKFKAHWWSPSSDRIALLRLDESPVREFTVVDHRNSPLVTEVTNYPKAGAPNPTVALGVASVAGNEIVWVDDSSYNDIEHLIVRVGWTPDGARVVYQVQDRQQTWMDLNLADPETGAVTNLLRETSPTFVEVDMSGTPHWLEDGSFLWLSGRTGYHHVYHFEPDGSTRRQITDGEWEISTLHGIDESTGWIYFTATEHAPTERHLYRVSLDGSDLEKLTDRPGTHSIVWDPTFRFFFDTWSDIHTPPRVSLHTADGGELRTVADNTVPELAELDLGTVEFKTVTTPDGFELEALWIKPPDFDPEKKYPVIQYNYGGPHAPVVVNRWTGSRGMWHHYLAQRGFVVWMCDNRSASGKGIKPTWEAYGRLGEIELRDIEHCLDWLETHPWVDSERIGLWGGSYGGFMATYALTHSNRFKAAVAWAPVTDWRLYDSIYTERYMKTPQENPDGYDAASVVQAAEKLTGRLLLAHGTIDDNVHFQNSVQLINALQKAGKEFELMIYPGSRHGISEREQQLHFYSLMTRFFRENL